VKGVSTGLQTVTSISSLVDTFLQP